jgi:hypothetical protein
MSVTRKMGKSVLVVVVLAVLFALAPAVSAFADADTRSTHASCMGYEASSLSPPGSSDELVGGMPALKAFFDEAFPGVPSGVFFGFIAHLHEHSHEGCDEVLD